MLHEATDRNQTTRQRRQLAIHLAEHFHHLRHHIAEQAADHCNRDHRQHGRIDHRDFEALGDALALFHKIGEAREYGGQMPSLRTGRNGGAIDRRKNPRELIEAGSEAVAFEYARTDIERDALEVTAFRLFGQGRQGVIEWQAGIEQGAEQAREQHHLVATQARAAFEAARRAAIGAGAPAVFDAERHQALIAQALARLLFGVGFGHPALAGTAGGQGEVVKGRHGGAGSQLAVVTRINSSAVVSPASTLSRPLSNRLGEKRRT